MLSPDRSLSLFLLPTKFKLILITAAAAANACGGDVCGPGDAPVNGLAVSSSDLQTSGGITYGDATTSPNNDCSIDSAPTSLTIDIRQVDPITVDRRALILCVPRPDRLDTELALTSDRETTGVQVIDIFADDGSCLIGIDRTRAPTGTARFDGACEDGTDSAGYALTLTGEIPATQDCAGTMTSVTLSVSGEIAVRAL